MILEKRNEEPIEIEYMKDERTSSDDLKPSFMYNNHRYFLDDFRKTETAANWPSFIHGYKGDDYACLFIEMLNDEAVNVYLEPFNIDWEYKVVIPEYQAVIYMQEGSGDNLDLTDREMGMDSYIDYKILCGLKNAGDGGMYMYNGTDVEKWIEKIPETIGYALDLDEIPDFYIIETEE